MTGRIVTHTVIHVSSEELAPMPYAIVIADVEGERVAARADGDMGWLEVGGPVELAADRRFGLVAAPIASGSRADVG